MRDYAELVKDLRYCADLDKDCLTCKTFEQHDCFNKLGADAADAIEELQDQIADVSKMICDLIAYAQKNADESREAEQRHYGSDSTVNVYTWMHNVKCVHERYVAMLDDIAAKLPEPPKGVE